MCSFYMGQTDSSGRLHSKASEPVACGRKMRKLHCEKLQRLVTHAKLEEGGGKEEGRRRTGRNKPQLLWRSLWPSQALPDGA